MKSVPRLQKQFQPVAYNLVVHPDIATMTFQGTVTIRGKKVGRPSQRFTFHQHDLLITEAQVTRHDKKGDHPMALKRINSQRSFDEVRLHLADIAYPGEYVVTMAFSGKITRAMTGLYPCFFKQGDEEKLILATQFESHHAREVFPCIDEPAAKATYDLAIIAPSDLTVLANTPIADQQPFQPRASLSLTKTTFSTSPRMSSYLLAFAIGDLHHQSTSTKNGTIVRAWASKAQPLSSLTYALDIAKRSIEFFEDYFQTPYPLPKVDHLALPDFTSGAMENWGLITYRERALLAYPDETSQSLKEYIAMVIAHETSHQWFGNLVTMAWWNDLWLNESFANLMEYEAVNSFFPDWHLWDTFVLNEGISALRRDAIYGVQAVQTEVHHPDEIGTLFDPSIVYAKGGRLLYMLKNYIGEDAFRKGLMQYFANHAYGNTSSHDLWAALGTSSDKDIAAFMNPWLEQPGFPVVSADQSLGSLKLSQTRFFENGETSGNTTWPVALFASDAKLPEVLMSANTTRDYTSLEPIRLNQKFAGHYIVHYVQKTHREHLISLIESGKLSVPDRLMHLNAAVMLARAGYQSYAEVISLLQAFSKEQTEAVWGVISSALGEARRFIDSNDKLEYPLKGLIRTLIHHQYSKLGWSSDAHESVDTRKLRATVLGLGSYAEETSIVAEALKQFDADSTSHKVSDPELRAIIFSTAIREHYRKAFDQLIMLHDATNNSDLKSDIMAALTSTHDPSEASRLLSRLEDASVIKPQDADYWLIYLLRNRYSREAAWQWMETNWSWIKRTYAHDKSYDIFPRAAAGICNTASWAERYTRFFGPKSNEIALKRNIMIGQNEIAARLRWLERDLPAMEQLLLA